MSPASLLTSIFVAAASVRFAAAATAQVFSPPGKGPLVQTANYTSFSNSTLHDHKIVKGKAFDRIINIWLENTDFEVASTSPIFESLSEQGIVFTSFHSTTHPSQPNYVASVGGYHWGMSDDNMYHIPSNISCVVDLLEDRGISWATYQENMPTDSYYGNQFTAPNYINSSAAPYTYYLRKHNPLMTYDAVSQDAERVKRVRTFNDFANDVVNGSLPQWMFITPNMVNDAHDTTIDFAGDFLEYWLLPLLTDPRVNGERTLILLTFDENETWEEQNVIFAVALGTAVPVHLRGTTDDTIYTHYSALSTIQNNWDLKSLGREDTNASIASVFDFVAKQTGHKNTPVAANLIPQFNLTGVASGPLTSVHYVPFSAPNVHAKGAGKGGVLLRPGIDLKLTADKLPAPVNLNALNTTTPWQMSPKTTSGKSIIPCQGAACP